MKSFPSRDKIEENNLEAQSSSRNLSKRSLEKVMKLILELEASAKIIETILKIRT